jgi:excisionase family DNA binding protein
MPTPPNTRPSEPLIGIAEVAELLGVEVRHVRRLVYERRIPFIKWGHLLRFDRADLTAWIASNRHEPAAPDGHAATRSSLPGAPRTRTT